MDAEWVFFATSHGEPPSDGIGGAGERHAAKRPVDNQVLDY